MRSRASFSRAVMFLALVAPALPAETQRADTYGTVAVSVLTVPASAFQPAESGLLYTTSSGERYRTGGTSATFEAPAALPGGAAVTAIQLDGCDTSNTAELDASLLECAGGACTALAATGTGGAETPGCSLFPGSVSPAHTIDNVSKTYLLRVFSQASDSTTRFRAVRVFYRLQVSSAPATATFADVPTDYLYFRAIEALAASGITSGCGGGNFCPNQFVTRGELAKFLANALGLHFP